MKIFKKSFEMFILLMGYQSTLTIKILVSHTIAFAFINNILLKQLGKIPKQIILSLLAKSLVSNLERPQSNTSKYIRHFSKYCHFLDWI